MVKVLQTQHQFRGYHTRSADAVCEVAVYTAPGLPPLVIATELPENTSTSITNLAEQVAAEVMERYLTADMMDGHQPPFIWVERYRRDAATLRALQRPLDEHEDWSLVTFKDYDRRQKLRAGSWRHEIGEPDWTSLTRAEFDDLLAPYL